MLSKTSIFKLRPLLRFLCLTNSFYKRCASNLYNRSTRWHKYNKLNFRDDQQKQLFESVHFRTVISKQNPFLLTAFKDYYTSPSNVLAPAALHSNMTMPDGQRDPGTQWLLLPWELMGPE